MTPTEPGPPPAVTVRPGRDSDAEALVALAHDVWPAAYAFAPGAAEHTIATWWSPEATTTSLAATTWLVAERDGMLVGAGNLDHRQQVPTIWKLLVHPGEQGRGTGTALVEALADLAGDAGVRLSYLTGSERAAMFYAARGFAVVGSTPADGPDPAEVVVERGGPGPTSGCP